MYDGMIKDCTAERYAGAVDAWGIFNMYGGVIDNCTANRYNGGGIEAESSGFITMYGGTIQNCKAENSGNNAKGGGVSVAGPFVMNGGTITYRMASQPNTQRGTAPTAAPYSFTFEK